MPKFYVNPFAVGGDKQLVPDNSQPNNSISYDEGYSDDYELEQGVDPNAKDIERLTYNQVLFDATENIRQWQTFGFFPRITQVQNGGLVYEYEKNAICVGLDGNLYESSIANNPNNAPGVGWDLVSNFARIADLITLTGRGANATDMGSFSGSTIPNGSDIKEALQAVETKSEEIIGTSRIANGAVTNQKLATNAVTTDKIQNGTIQAADIATNTITATQLAANSVTSSELAANSVTNVKMDDNSVGANEIIANAVGTSEIAANAVTASEIAANAVGSSEIATNAVGASEIASNAVTTVKILNANVTEAKLSAGVVSKLNQGNNATIQSGYLEYQGGTTYNWVAGRPQPSGWTFSRLGSGQVQLTKTTNTLNYSVVAIVAQATEAVVHIEQQGTTTFVVEMDATNTGNKVDASFYFIYTE